MSQTFANKKTREILEHCRIHGQLYPIDAGAEFRISSVSRWLDPKWIFDGRTAGSSVKRVTVNWSIDFSDGSNLIQPCHATLLSETRHLLWGLFVDRRNGKRLKTSNIENIYYPLKRLLQWMVKNNYKNFSELGANAFDHFVAELERRAFAFEGTSNFDFTLGIADHEKTDFFDSDEPTTAEDEVDEAEGMTYRAFYPYIRMWGYLWEQQDALASAGIKSIKENPFLKESALDISLRLASRVCTLIPALPDEVAIAIMNAAQKFIVESSADIVRLIPHALRLRTEIYSTIKDPIKKGPALNHALSTFEFGILPGANRPWRQPLGITNIPVFVEIRTLLDTLIAACIILIKSETGMRISEIASLLAGLNQETGLPSCIEIRLSKSGMLDLFYLKGKLSKMRATPTEEEWLLAARPHALGEIPEPVNAVLVLQNVLQYFRAIAPENVRNSLIVTFSLPRSLPWEGKSITLPLASNIIKGARRFYEEYVNWDTVELNTSTKVYKETKGSHIVSHQWRKTYAQFVFQVDARLLPAIARQFKHLSLAMTEGAYIGTSISLVQGIADHNRKLTVDLLLMNARGEASKQEGRLSKLMKEHQSQLAEIISTLDEESARQQIENWCKNRDVKLFFHEYGKCMPAISPVAAECHKRSNTVHWANKAPNFSMREPSVCIGCQLFLSGPESISYWNNRYVENRLAWMGAKERNEESQYRVAKFRSEQSATYLTLLGSSIPEVTLK